MYNIKTTLYIKLNEYILGNFGYRHLRKKLR